LNGVGLDAFDDGSYLKVDDAVRVVSIYGYIVDLFLGYLLL